jgi:hypothetical protein
MHGGVPGQPSFFHAGAAYWHVGAEAALRDRTANWTKQNRIYLIEKIEVR